jgi:predicted ATP-grasp superfamily ATP-dependent carboligase
VLECVNVDELRSNFTRAYETHRSLIVQEVVVGPDSQIVFSHTYVGRDGRELAMWTGRKLRQLPIHYGSATAAIAHRDPAVADYTRRLLANRNFVGYASVEFKIDTRDNSHRVLEATIARTCYHHALGLAMNVNIPLLWYNDALGKPVSPVAAEYNDAMWIDEYRDVAAAIAYSRAGELTLPEWLNSLRGARSYAHLAFDDVAPGASLGAQFAVGAFSYAGKRIASLLKGTSTESPDFGE